MKASMNAVNMPTNKRGDMGIEYVVGIVLCLVIVIIVLISMGIIRLESLSLIQRFIDFITGQ